jgi:S1-C subfamily serine protease
MKRLVNRRSAVMAAAAVLCSTSVALAGTADPSLAGSVERARRATVGVLSIGQGAPGLPGPSQLIARGSGFHVKDGYIVTARHVVEREEGAQSVAAKEITVLTSDLEELPAVLIGASSYVDVAVYRVTGPRATSLAPAAFAEKEPEPGDEVFMVGFPLGWGPAIGFGRIGNPNTFLPTVNTRLMQLDASACAGNSGGGLFNPRGEVVGIVHAIIHTDGTQEDRRCSRFAFAIPVTLANRIVTALMQGSEPAFSRLGVQLTAVKVGTKWQASVLEAIGPAHDGGIRRGDILLAIDDTPITDAAQLKNYLIERTVPGQKVAVRVRRGQTEQVFMVTLGKS